MLKTGKFAGPAFAAPFAALAILSALAVTPAFAEEKSVAVVNGVSIPQARVDMRVKMATAQGQVDSPELRKAIRDDMISLEVLAQEAKKAGLEKDHFFCQGINIGQIAWLHRYWIAEKR